MSQASASTSSSKRAVRDAAAVAAKKLSKPVTERCLPKSVRTPVVSWDEPGSDVSEDPESVERFASIDVPVAGFFGLVSSYDYEDGKPDPLAEPSVSMEICPNPYRRHVMELNYSISFLADCLTEWASHPYGKLKRDKKKELDSKRTLLAAALDFRFAIRQKFLVDLDRREDGDADWRSGALDQYLFVEYYDGKHSEIKSLRKSSKWHKDVAVGQVFDVLSLDWAAWREKNRKQPSLLPANSDNEGFEYPIEAAEAYARKLLSQGGLTLQDSEPSSSKPAKKRKRESTGSEHSVAESQKPAKAPPAKVPRTKQVAKRSVPNKTKPVSENESDEAEPEDSSSASDPSSTDEGEYEVEGGEKNEDEQKKRDEMEKEDGEKKKDKEKSEDLADSMCGKGEGSAEVGMADNARKGDEKDAVKDPDAPVEAKRGEEGGTVEKGDVVREDNKGVDEREGAEAENGGGSDPREEQEPREVPVEDVEVDGLGKSVENKGPGVEENAGEEETRDEDVEMHGPPDRFQGAQPTLEEATAKAQEHETGGQPEEPQGPAKGEAAGGSATNPSKKTGRTKPRWSKEEKRRAREEGGGGASNAVQNTPDKAQ